MKTFAEIGRQFVNGGWRYEPLKGQSEHAHLAQLSEDRTTICLLAAILVELQTLNAVFACKNAQAIPTLLRSIAKNTRKKRKEKA